MTWINLW